MLIRRSWQIKERQVRLCLVNHLHQLSKYRADPWGVLWAMRAMKRQNRDGSGQLLHGQQGIPLELLGNGSGGEWGHRVLCDFLQGSHTPKVSY